MSAFFGWPQLNAALAEHRLTPPRLRLERGGGDVTAGLFRSRRSRRGAALLDLDAAALMERLREGATLIVDAVNELSPPLQALCAGLSAEFVSSCQANMYACWGTTQGFDVHWDDHDVFVVQLAGRKQWALYGATEASPTRRGPQPPASPPQDPRELAVLEPGDVLYLPRGYWHAAVGLGGPTMHLTIGLTRKSASDFLHWLADDLLGAAEIRADLPFEAGERAIGARIAAVLGRLAQAEPQALARRYRRHVEAMLVQRPALSFPDIGAEDAPLAPDRRLRLAAGPARLERTDAAVVLSWRGVEFSLAPALEAPVRRMLAGEAVTCAAFAAAAPTHAEAEVQALLREMVRRGAFAIDGEGL
ncbi:hypothetical protein LJR219_001700 [Phenylobacterium sp. LjRoot219]|uniref:cupin domain-containing protein n=1 Tax=Phenylobacterium sp. LjRoot219 TaxID=3342283 RepID=UPI003ED0273A